MPLIAIFERYQHSARMSAQNPARIAAYAALMAFSMGLVACTETRARYHAHLGTKAYQEGKYAQAIAYFEAAVAARPELSLAWFNLGVTHRALFAPGLRTQENAAHAHGAIQAFTRYLAQVPMDRDARELLLSTYLDTRQTDPALALLEAELVHSRDPIAVTARLAELATQVGRWEAARLWAGRRAELERNPEGRADAWLAIGSLALRRLAGSPEVTGDLRREWATDGLSFVRRADALRPSHAETRACLRALEREREVLSLPDAGP